MTYSIGNSCRICHDYLFLKGWSEFSFVGNFIGAPYFTFPRQNIAAIWLIMLIATATIPEFTAYSLAMYLW